MEIKRCYDTIIGASVGENQLVQSGDTSVTVPNGHKYYSKINGTETLGASTGTAIAINDSAKDMVTDLTQKLGSAIADYVYGLGTSSGIAKLRSWGFLRGYQAFNAGSLESVEVTGKKVVGFNQWDEEWEVGGLNTRTGEPQANPNCIRSKNYTPVIPSATYYCRTINPATYIWFYDANKTFIEFRTNTTNRTFTIPSNGAYIKIRVGDSGNPITTYHNDTCINLSSDRNGEYEPYTEQTYDYGDDTLRGIFKLDANNNLYADGDRKEADGTITRKYGIRAYQSGDESLADAFTNGIQTVYKLTTPTTEQGDPFPSPQVCYPDGTEEYITGNGVPVGHETRYEL